MPFKKFFFLFFSPGLFSHHFFPPGLFSHHFCVYKFRQASQMKIVELLLEHQYWAKVRGSTSLSN